MTDYLILGGGIAGCVLATRLKEYQPSLSVTLIEAGPNEHENPLITEPMGTFQLHMSTMQYNYKTVPQKNFNNRRVYNAGGKQLSGSRYVFLQVSLEGRVSSETNVLSQTAFEN